jgi:hypothetical protein
MRLKGRQTRFLLTILSGWIALRLFAFWGGAGDAPPAGPAIDVARSQRTKRHSPASRPLLRPPHEARRSAIAHKRDFGLQAMSGRYAAPSAGAERRDASLRWAEPSPENPAIVARQTGAGIPSPFFPAPPPSPAAPKRLMEGQAYLFVRPGSGRALASGSALGGSQIAGRVAVAIDGGRHLAAAARVYAPLHAKGAEVAAGIDFRPDPTVPFRFSIERRQRLDRAGRSAWSAYAAGGFYRELAGVVRVDGYAQAGFVGFQRRDGFVDGAIRGEHPVTIGPVLIGFGGGLWGAAQPGARRIDAGPRVSIHLPLAGRSLSFAVEGRFRLAGNARPGSGVALTLAGDL